jgi:hypothetical protein
MVNYQLGKIYKIVCNNTGDVYVGSTCEPTLARRLQNHLASLRFFKEGKTKSTITSFEILEGGNYDIILIEDFPCERKDQLRARERHHIESIDCVNKVIPTRTKKEYNDEHKDKRKADFLKYYHETGFLQNKEHYERHKEYYQKKNKRYSENEYFKQYYKKNRDKIKETTKQFREHNKDKVKERMSEYYEKNKEKLNEKHTCECGGKYTTLGKAQHLKTKKHQTYIASSTQVV